MKSYDYARRRGVWEVSWSDFGVLSRLLAEKIEPYQPEMILGIARAGLFPATAVACALRRELCPIRLTRRFNDQVVYDQPVWKVGIPDDVKGRAIAIIDEIADSGQTLALAAQAAREKGAAGVVTASLVSHTWADPKPQAVALESDAMIIFPWDRSVRADGQWQMHPEIVSGLEAQAGSYSDAMRQPSLRIIEIRRHTERGKPGQHLTQAGVELARRVGAETGAFTRVITSTVPRAFETALAMGFAVDEQVELLSTLTGGVEAEVAWDAGFLGFGAAFKRGGALQRFALTLADYFQALASALPARGKALVITHGGIVEAAAVGCLPYADHAIWGEGCGYCEGVRLYFDGERFFAGEVLRVSNAA